ncbi:hypothetical protein [Streptomyces sp. CB00316]|uniref:hypothetical protein n=1 Tax=Streptomyces sp. CB00316 TaxID=1703932 RepID=UPI000A7F9DD9|nr:hypothetical protein [Streptomyces sp. CB00316]
MNTTPSRTTDLSKTATPADDPEQSTTDAVVTEDTTATAAPAEDTDDAEDDDLEPDPFTEACHGVGAGATAVVSAALGIVALTGAWSGRVAAERETLMGQIQTAGGSSAAQQISEVYGDAWHTTGQARRVHPRRGGGPGPPPAPLPDSVNLAHQRSGGPS